MTERGRGLASVAAGAAAVTSPGLWARALPGPENTTCQVGEKPVFVFNLMSGAQTFSAIGNGRGPKGRSWGGGRQVGASRAAAAPPPTLSGMSLPFGDNLPPGCPGPLPLCL